MNGEFRAEGGGGGGVLVVRLWWARTLPSSRSGPDRDLHSLAFPRTVALTGGLHSHFPVSK